MLNNTQIEARRMVITEIGKLIEKNQKKADKEKAKQKNAFVTYKGDKYYSESDLQDAYGCDAFSSATYDRLLEKLDKARGNVDADAYTPTEMLMIELGMIKSNIEMELSADARDKKRQAKVDARIEELKEQGHSIREINAIIGNEELMRFE